MVDRRLAFLPCLAVLVACNLPERDNRYDPIGAPVASLVILNADPVRDPFGRPVEVNGLRTCEQDAAGAVSSVEFSRGRCIVFNAEGSRPGNDATIESVRFDGNYTGPGDETFEGDPGLGGTALVFAVAGVDVFPLPTDWPAAAPGDTITRKPIRVRVRIRDTRGRVADAVADLTLTNSPPVAVPPGPIALSSVGAAWNGLGATMPVRLDGSRSHDPDDDELGYCWFRNDGNGPGGCGPGGNPDYSAPAVLVTSNGDFGFSSRYLTFQLGVTDGTFRSEPAVATVVTRTPLAWGLEDSDGTAVQVDVRRIVRTAPPQAGSSSSVVLRDMTTGALAVGFASQSGSELSIYSTTQDTSQTITFPANERITFVEPYYVPFFTAPQPPDEGTSRFWVFTKDGAGTLTGVHVVDRPYLAASYSLAATWVPPQAIAGNFDSFFVAIDEISRDGDRGNLWFMPQFSNVIQGLRFDPVMGTITELGTFAVPDGYMATGLSMRTVYVPGLGEERPELWAVFGRDVTIAGSTGVAFARVIPQSPDAPCTTMHDVPFEAAPGFDTPPEVAWSLEFDSESTAWTNLMTHGLARYRVESPAGDPCDLVLTPETFVPGVNLGFQYLVEESIGQIAMIEQGGHSLVRALPGGFVIRSESQVPARGLWSNFQGGMHVLFDGDDGGPATVLESVGSGPDGVVSRTQLYPAPLEKARAADYSDGSFWVGTIFPAGVQRVDPTGALADSFTAVAVAGTNAAANTVNLGPPVLVRSDAASGDLYVFGAREVLTSLGADTIYRVAPRAARIAPEVASLASGIALPPPGGNLPAGLRALDAAVQPSDAGSTLVVAAVDTAGSGNLYLQRFDAMLQPLGSATVTDIADPGRFALERDLGTNEVVLVYRDDANGLTMRKYVPDLSSSALYDLQQTGVEPADVTCLLDRCVAVWQGSNTGLAYVGIDDVVRIAPPASAANLPNPPRSVNLVVESSDYLRAWVQGDSSAVVFQLLDGGTPFAEPPIALDRRATLVWP